MAAGPYVVVCDVPPIPLSQLELEAHCESSAGWVEFDLQALSPELSSGPVLPPMTIEDAFVIGGAMVLLWVTAFCVRAVIRLVQGAYY